MLLRALARTFVIIVGVMWVVLASPDARADEFDLLFSEFDARRMSPGEKRFIGEVLDLLDNLGGVHPR